MTNNNDEVVFLLACQPSFNKMNASYFLFPINANIFPFLFFFLSFLLPFFRPHK